MNKKIKFMSASILGILFLTYSIFIEPLWLEITHHQLSLNINPTKKLKIIQITDLHTKGLGALEQKVISKTKEENPDIIFLTGDIATPNGTVHGYEEVLKNFKAPLGVYYISGNWEDWEPIPDLQNILKKNNIIDLTNRTKKLDQNLWLAGFADALTDNPDLKILKNIPKKSKILSIFHSPALFKEINKDIDYGFAGHTHGGQIRLPFLGAIVLPPSSDHYDQGWFHENRAKMYVSRGIGTSIVPMRFWCRPELSVFEVRY